MARSGWAASAATVLLVAGLGNEPALDAAVDADRQAAPLLRALTAFPAWHAGALGFESDMYAAIAVKIVVLLVLVFLLGRAAGHVGASVAAFLAGWGALMIAAAVAGVVYVLVADMAVLDGRLADTQGGAGAVVVDGLNRGAVFGLYTGWLVGGLVVLTARPGGLEDAAGWPASPPSRTLPGPLPGARAPAAGATGAIGAAGPAAPEAMADMNLVPGMPSVSTTGVAPPPGPDPWAPPAAGPVGRSATGGWGRAPQPQPFADPGAGPAPADGAWSPQLPSNADAAARGPGGGVDPSPWAAPPAPEPSTEGQPFVPPGTWPRPAVGGGVAPTAESPVVPSGAWPSDVEPPAAAGGPVVPSGSWPPSVVPEPGAPSGVGQPPVVPSGSWPPSAREEPPAGGVPPSYEQPEYSGLAPSRSGPGDPLASPEPPPAADPGAVGPDAGEPGRPLWPSSWPATSSGASTERQDVGPTDQGERLSRRETAENGARTSRPGTDAGEEPATGAGDEPDGANTRFW